MLSCILALVGSVASADTVDWPRLWTLVDAQDPCPLDSEAEDCEPLHRLLDEAGEALRAGDGPTAHELDGRLLEGPVPLFHALHWRAVHHVLNQRPEAAEADLEAGWRLAQAVEDSVDGNIGWWTAVGFRQQTLHAVVELGLGSDAWVSLAEVSAPTEDEARRRAERDCHLQAELWSDAASTGSPMDRLAAPFYDRSQTRAWMLSDCLHEEVGLDAPGAETSAWDVVTNPVGALKRFDVGFVWSDNAQRHSTELIADYGATYEVLVDSAELRRPVASPGSPR